MTQFGLRMGCLLLLIGGILFGTPFLSQSFAARNPGPPAQSEPILPPRISRPIAVVVGLNGAQVLPTDGEYASYSLPSGTILQAVGRSEDSAWLFVESESGQGWTARENVIAFGLDAVPIIALPDMEKMDASGSTDTDSTNTDNSDAPTVVSSSSHAPSDASDTLARPSSTTNDDQLVNAVVTEITSRLNVRAGPGLQHGVITQVTAGQDLTLLARNPASNWLQIVLPSSRGNANTRSRADLGWVAASFVEVNGSIDSLPISSVTSQASAVPNQPSTSGPVASPTGLQGTLVFQQSIGGTLYAYNLSNGALLPLTSGQEPDLSPDGRTVVFVRGGGANGLYLIDIDGTNERLIFSGRENLASPKWSPDGSEIIFTRGDEWLGCQRRGSREVCSEVRTVGASQYRKTIEAISLVDQNGGNFRDVVSQRPSKAPDWTEAGITYQSPIGLQLTQPDFDAVNELVYYDYIFPITHDPDRQPGGGTIIFQVHEGSHWQLYAVESDGNGRRSLTRPLTTLVDQLPSSVAPAWGPDGQQVVYLSNMLPTGEAGPWKLWVMNGDGTNQRPLPINLELAYTFGVEQVVSWR
ncbi:MAG: SH3 domain-containing protein [Chloroflexota bacterium]